MIKKYLIIALLIGSWLSYAVANPIEEVGRKKILPKDKISKELERKDGFPKKVSEDTSPLLDTPISHEASFNFPKLDESLKAVIGRRAVHLSFDNPPEIDVSGDNMSDIFVAIGSGDVNENVRKARRAVKKAIDAGGFIRKLTGEDLVSLPLVLSDTISNVVYNMTISKMQLKTTHTELEIILGIEIPNQNFSLYFGSPNIKFTKEGGIVGDATLGLYSDVAIPIANQKSALVLRAYEEGPNGLPLGTFVTIDCDGFKEMAVKADLIFSRDWIVPVDNNGDVLPTGRVQGTFQTILTDWNDLLIDNLTLPNFALASFDDIAFNITNAVFDFSDFRNGQNVNFPPLYAQQNLLPGNASLWRGVYFENVEIVLPKQFTLKNCNTSNNCRVKVGANDLLIDPNGVSAEFYAQNIFGINDGEMDKWRWSLDQISVDVVASNVTGFGFEGEIGVPIAKETTPFGYTAFFDLQLQEYNFSILNPSNMEFPLWQAGQVTIAAGSKLEITATPTKFKPVAILNGSVDINAKFDLADNEEMVKLVGLQFQKLKLQTQAPYIGLDTGGSMSLSTGLTVANFPVSIANPSIQSTAGGGVELKLGVAINLMSQTNGGFAATTDVSLFGDMDASQALHIWKYSSMQINSATISISLPKLDLDGQIDIFRNDPDYGNGFHGSLSVDVLDGKFEMDAETYFGNVNNYRYWYFDVKVQSNALSIPLYPPVVINGFGGGAYHHMKMASFTANPDPDKTGVEYVPSQSVALGLKASVLLSSVEGTLDGEATLEMVFGSGMSLQDIVFYGKAELATDNIGQGLLDNRISKFLMNQQQTRTQDDAESQNPLGKISAALFMRMNFTAGFELQGTFNTYLNAGNGIIVGSGSADLLLSTPQNKWHLYIGGYSDGSITVQQLSNTVTLYPVSVSIQYENDPNDPSDDIQVSASAYFLTGNDIPGPPPLDPQAAAVFGVNNSNRGGLGGTPALGTGFAFGAAANFNFTYTKTPNKRYVNLSGGVGFDISLLKYANGTTCSLSNTSPHGLKHWRANGNLWTFMSASGKWKVIATIPFNVSLGVLLQADVPKPSYFNGQVALQLPFGINVPFGVSVGQQCGTVY